MAVEREIKFTVPARDVFDRIIALRDIAGYRCIDRGIRHQTDTCYDTPDRRLYHGKAALRLRRRDDRAVVTFKAHGGMSGGVYHRTEIESPVDPAAIDPGADAPPESPALDALRAEFGEVELARSLEVANNRRIIDLVRGDTAVYELALDDVTFRGRDGEARVLELEVEALSQDDSDLAAIGGKIAARFHLTPAGPSKYVRGMNLVGGV